MALARPPLWRMALAAFVALRAGEYRRARITQPREWKYLRWPCRRRHDRGVGGIALCMCLASCGVLMSWAC